MGRPVKFLYGNNFTRPFCMPSIYEVFCFNIAPAQGTSLGILVIILTTDIASCRFPSTSFSRSLLAPLRSTANAIGSSQSTMKVRTQPQFSPTSRATLLHKSTSIFGQTTQISKKGAF